MKLAGLQKVTLLDFPGKLACTIFTCGCNFRCPFCHNEDLVWHAAQAPEYPIQTVLDYLNERKNYLEGVCITGGEPLVQKEEEIISFIQTIKDLGLLVKLDTNGTNPATLRKLIDNKLIDMVAMDIKTSIEKYPILAGLGKDDFGKKALNLDNAQIDNMMNNVKESIGIIMEGKINYEFRTTVIKPLHQLEDFEEIGKLINGAENYFIQSYRHASQEAAADDIFSAYSSEELETFKNIVQKYVKNAKVRGI